MVYGIKQCGRLVLEVMLRLIEEWNNMGNLMSLWWHNFDHSRNDEKKGKALKAWHVEHLIA